MMELEALHVTVLTEEVGLRLEAALGQLVGIEGLRIDLEEQEIQIWFDERRLGFLRLTQVLAEVGCPLRNINAVVLKDLSKK
jgi:hypothetical protein